MITNPPYGERIEVEDMEALYQSIGEKLKKVFQGYNAWIIGYKNELFDYIGLKPSLKYPLLNGSLECELRQYVIFSGSYSQFRKEGNSVKNEMLKSSDAKPEYRYKEFKTTFRESALDRRNERKSRFGITERPKNALEEKYRRRPIDRKDERGSRPFDRKDEPHERVHNEEFANKVVRFRQPKLSAENERPIVKGRRNGWRRKGLPEDAGNE